MGPMIQMSQTPLEARSASPALGEHTDAILGSMGYTQEEIADMKRDDVTR